MNPEHISSKEPGAVAHHIRVSIDPEKRTVRGVDRITLPLDMKPDFRFSIHSGMNPRTRDTGVKLIPVKSAGSNTILETWSVSLPEGTRGFTLEYEGVIYHPMEQIGKEYARDFRGTPGIISAEGVYLSGNSGWYPLVENRLVTFTLEAELPEKWDAVSQGNDVSMHGPHGKAPVKWSSMIMQDEIFLIAGTFRRYVNSLNRVKIMAFLRTPDDSLAAKYMVTAQEYISMYDTLLGPYPYGKFALVENFWETGYGMPSFTLLGPKIIRFPFILHSSYPHEILHNWWGNGVFTDTSGGNWSEGLTAYLSDHLISDQRGGGAGYRMNVLQKYADYVSGNKDFPLKAFTSRYSSTSEAVGYGKSLMFFHMLRLGIGDDAFVRGLRIFYEKNRFRHASFDDLKIAFEEASGKKLAPLFKQWIDREGGPELKVSSPAVEKKGNGYILTALLEQVHHGGHYDMDVPVAVTMKGVDKALQSVIHMTSKKNRITISLDSMPVRIDVDPEFDIFRRLHRRETPPAVSQVLGSAGVLVIIAKNAHPDMQNALRVIISSIRGAGPEQVDVIYDTEISELPTDRAIILLGWENRFIPAMVKFLSKFNIPMNSGSITIEGGEMDLKNRALAVIGTNPGNDSLPLMLIASGDAAILPAMARKIPHYHKYSYLVFEGPQAGNIARGQWPVAGSPLTMHLSSGDMKTGIQLMASLEKRKPLMPRPGNHLK